MTASIGNPEATHVVEGMGTASDPVKITAPTAAKPSRNAALDFTKGALVLFMVLYHWVNYFVSPSGFHYRYIRFVTPSFISLAGLLVTHVYANYATVDAVVTGRLLRRGLKLLMLFTALNLTVGYLFGLALGTQQILADFVSKAPLIYTIGLDQSSAFEILVPIAYLLLLSPLALLAHQRYRYGVHVFSALLFVAVWMLGRRGISSFNLNLMAVGSVGLVVGYTPMRTFDQLSNRLPVVGGAYLLYLIALTIWGAPYVLQIVGAWLSIATLYSVGVRYGRSTPVQRHLILLGQYSLFAYLVQIAALRVLRPLLDSSPDLVRWPLSLAIATLLTSASVICLNYMNANWRLAARFYRFVFG
jgi:hypothetical protein